MYLYTVMILPPTAREMASARLSHARLHVPFGVWAGGPEVSAKVVLVHEATSH